MTKKRDSLFQDSGCASLSRPDATDSAQAMTAQVAKCLKWLIPNSSRQSGELFKLYNVQFSD